MSSTKLFCPITVGDVKLSHRVVMAPLTRFRADANHVASRLMLQYYTQRAAVPGTLLIAEATYISPAHCGGQIEGYPLYSSSPVSMDASSPGPEEMIDSAIWSCPGDSRTAAQNAIRAGFDGVEMHGVDEYFVGRFSQDTVNQRTDSRGCSVDNRSRFALKVVKAVTNAIGSNKVGMRLSPWSTFQGMKMRTDVAERQFRTLSATEGIEFALDIWQDQGPVFVAGGYDGARARSAVDGEHQDRDTLIVFGRYFLSSPDLVYRLQHGIEPNEYDCSTF
ncbi:hypothetical protein BN1723_008437 [Verticillium longisporum]|uniref:NADH:flavin oxidoreductase/NADH oxidase N-terminal domain-containing protein n=1 Tax=Verticillium longisporum TaxID=100787 RepID=A0A0G4KFE6_VERLO|nr:hypothetical protein BN1723_008437 [Verticillium longisporum]